MMPLVLFCSRSFTIANVITLLIYGALTETLYYLPLHLIQVEHYSATRAGAALLPIGLLISVLSQFTGGLVARLGPRLPVGVGALLSAIGYALLLRVSSSGGYWGTVFPGVCLLGLGLAVLVAPLTTTVMNSVGEGRSGAASGINNAISNVASLLAISAFGILFSSAFQNCLSARLAVSSLPILERQAMNAHRLEFGGMSATAGPVAEPIVNAASVHALHLVLIGSLVLSSVAAAASIFLQGAKVTSEYVRDRDAALKAVD